MRPQPRKIDDLIDPPKQMIGRDMPLKAELVEQRFLRRSPIVPKPPSLKND